MTRLALVAALLLAPAALADDAPPAIYFQFSAEGTNVHLESTRRLHKICPPSDTLPKGPVSGDRVELQDAKGKRLYVAVQHDMLGQWREVPNADQSTLTHVKNTAMKSDFFVWVPDLPAAKTLVLFATLKDSSSAVEVGRFPLEKAPAKER